MPYGNPGPGGADMYSDAPEHEEAESHDEGGEKEEGTEYPPFTVPRTAFGGIEPKPGEQYYFDVKSVHEDEVVLAYATDVKEEEEEGGHKEEGPKKMEAPKGGGGGMDDMMY